MVGMGQKDCYVGSRAERVKFSAPEDDTEKAVLPKQKKKLLVVII